MKDDPKYKPDFRQGTGAVVKCFAIKARENLGATVNLDRFAQDSHSLFKKTKLIRVV